MVSPLSPPSRNKRGFEDEEEGPGVGASASAGQFPPSQKRKVAAVSKTTIDGKTIYIPARLADLGEPVLKALANMAIGRLQTMAGPTGLVVILSLSHTAILGTIEGKKVTVDQKKKQVVNHISENKRIYRAPDSYGLTLKAVDCFTLPSSMNLHKLNFAGAGAISCVGASGNPKVQITENNYYFIIFTIIRYYLMTPNEDGSPVTVESIAKNIFGHIDRTFRPVLKRDHEKKVADIYALYKRFSEAPQTKSMIESMPLLKLDDLCVSDFQTRNLELGLGLQQQHVVGPTCMFNKKYLRVGENAQEHYPALDWHVSAFDINGNILVGNIFDPTNTKNGNSTQIPSVIYECLEDLKTTFTDPSWAMDLITVIKILTGNDLVTTKDILGLLNGLGIVNVIFIDGGCNEFRDESKRIIIACGQGDPSLSMSCVSCGGPLPGHSRGGMKNKKIKTTKKKGRTVRGRRMRKSYRRYKRSKTYKR